MEVLLIDMCVRNKPVKQIKFFTQAASVQGICSSRLIFADTLSGYVNPVE